MNGTFYQRDYPRRLRVGLVGIGHHSYRTLIPAMHYLPVEIKALAYHSDNERAERTAAQLGCRAYASPAEMYSHEDLDAAIICVSPQLHPSLTIEAFEAGLHVWLEKPPAMLAADIEEMEAHRGDRVCVVGFKKAFMPAVDKILEIIHTPEYSTLQSLLAVYPMTIPADGESVLQERRFTNWLGNGVHPISFLMAVGGKVRSVVAHTGASGNGAFVMEFENGAIGTFHLASGPHPIERYSVYGDSWHCDVTSNTRIALHRSYGPTDTETFAPKGLDGGAVVWEAQNCLATIENYSFFTQGVYAEMRYFCDCVLEGRQPQRGTLDFALELMRVYEAGLRSHGKLITI